MYHIRDITVESVITSGLAQIYLQVSLLEITIRREIIASSPSFVAFLPHRCAKE